MRFYPCLAALALTSCGRETPQKAPSATTLTTHTPRIPEKRLSLHTLEGVFVGFGIADHIFAGIKRSGQSKPIWLALNPKLKVEYFLAINQNKHVKISYEIVDADITVGDGEVSRGKIERLVDAQCGSQRYSTWFNNLLQSKTEKQIEKEYSPLVDKAEVQQ